MVLKKTTEQGSFINLIVRKIFSLEVFPIILKMVVAREKKKKANNS